jgi:formylglycine-generating enzyme required for sulfatase activity
MPRWILFLGSLFVLLPSAAFAQVRERLAVLNVTSPSEVAPVSDLKVLGNAARVAATQAARPDVMVMTVEAMIALQEDLGVRCDSDSECAVSVGRMLNATLVLSGTLDRFGGDQLVLDLQLYNVLSGALLAAEQIRDREIGRLLDAVPLTTKGLLLKSGYSNLGGVGASAPSTSGGFSFDASGLNASVQSTAAAEAARQAELEAAAREAGCQKEAIAGAEKKQASALSAAVAKLSGEVDAAWGGLLPALQTCRGVDDMAQRGACAAQATAFADKASSAKATVGAASYAVTTACGSRNQAVGSTSAPVNSPRVAEARALAGELGKERYRGPGPTWDSPTLGTFRLIPAGTFTMGCKPGRDDVAGGCGWDDTPHTVTLTQAYYLMEHEVTQGEWQTVMGSNPSYSTSCGSRCPVERVSWDDVQAFIAKVSARDGVTYRLPTEAEWERAARGGQAFAYAGSSDVGAVAWYDGNSGYQPHPVCGKSRNGYGLCDMTGNVWEWVRDWDGAYGSASATDPRGPSAGSNRVARGGGWNSDARDARVACRCGGGPACRYGGLGFRLLRSVP